MPKKDKVSGWKKWGDILQSAGAGMQDVSAGLWGRPGGHVQQLEMMRQQQQQAQAQQEFEQWRRQMQETQLQFQAMRQGMGPATPAQMGGQQFLGQSRGGWGQPYMQPEMDLMGQKWIRQTPEPDEMPISDIIKSELWQRYLAGDDSPEVLKGLGMWVAAERPEKITSTDIKELEKLVPWWQRKTPLTGQAERDVRTARERLRERVLGAPQRRTERFTPQQEGLIEQYMKRHPKRSREEIINQMRKQGLL